MMYATSTDLYFLLWIFLNAVSAHISRIAVRLPLKGTRAPPGSPWPLPQKWQLSSRVRSIDSSRLHFVTNVPSCDIIEAAFQRYRKLMMRPGKGAGKSMTADDIQRVVVTVEETRCDAGYYPSETSDESYKLNVGSERDAIVEAKSIWGALRGLETFSQLVYVNDENKCVINDTWIDDFPRFHYRSLLIDTARHFIPMPVLLQILDAMSWDKWNVFHWHVVDDQSFPYPSRTFPNLTEFGSYSPSHRYSRYDVTRIIREARLRGIRVIPEFDTPGHTRSWGKALPKLLTACWGDGPEGGPYVPNYPLHGAAEVINPVEEYTYHVLKTLYEEIVQDFPDEYVHLGLDEAYHACWESNFEVGDWMRRHNISDYSRLEEYYIRRLSDIVTSLGAKYVIYQDPVDKNVTVTV
ncbi:Beta-hexosaminidase subunit alpha [Lamellibrachia satsuma]|nr:Beta-hexosaminidase subunit alpha [Lamellibrachia satsuma]